MIKSNYSDCPEIVRNYLFYLLTIKGRSKRTVDGYYIDLRTFFRYMLSYKNKSTLPLDEISIEAVDLAFISEITLSDVYEFLNYISSERGNSAVTRSRKVSSIRSFFNYLTNKVKLLETNPVTELEVPNVKKRLPKYLTLEQCYSLLKSVDGEYKERDYCIVTLFLNCGMRLSELVGINLSDISEDRLRLIGKGNKERIVYLNNACLSAIKEYLAYRNAHKVAPTDKNALFLNRNGKRIGARRVEQLIDEYLKKAGLENYGFSTHKLRHTAATIMYQNGGVDIRVLQEILGHSNLGTTEIYTHISGAQLESAAKSTPLSKIKAPVAEKPDEKE